MPTTIQKSAADLETIPGVGPKLAEGLRALGVQCVGDLSDRDPEQMYRDLREHRGRHIDRCVLYVYRCAVYYASRRTHSPRLLKWWNWKDTDQPKNKSCQREKR